MMRKLLLTISIVFVFSCGTAKDNQLSIYKNLEKTGVEIHINGQQCGSGAFVSPDGYILTASHIFNHPGKYSIATLDNKIYQAKLVAVFRGHDLALLKVAGKNFKYLKLSPQKALPGEEVYNFGAAFYRRGVFQKGFVASRETRFEYFGGDNSHFVEVDHISVTVQPGTSGGPWVNKRGELVGMQSGIMIINGSNSGLAFSAPLSAIRKIVQSSSSGETATQGLIVESLWNHPVRILKNYKDKTGAIIVGIREGAGKKAGIQKDDLVVEVNGQKIVRSYCYLKILRETPANGSLEIKFYRPGKGYITKKVGVDIVEKRFEKCLSK